MIRKFLLSTAAIAALSTTALAADLPSRAPPPVYIPPPAFTWSGVYVGATLGYAEGFTTFTDTGYFVDGASRQEQSAGLIGGGTLGINFQQGSLVYGLETDFSGLTNKKNEDYSLSFRRGLIGSDNYSFEDTGRMNWLGTVRGRIGLAVDRTMFYFTAGFAYANVKNDHSAAESVYFGEGVRSYGYDWNSNQTKFGWTAGLGLEYALTPNWTIKGEALYVDLNNTTVTPLYSQYRYGYSANTYDARFQNSAAIIRAGVNYKFDLFGAPAPIVAKY